MFRYLWWQNRTLHTGVMRVSILVYVGTWQLSLALAAQYDDAHRSNLMGYSPDLKIPLTADDIIPEVQYLKKKSTAVDYERITSLAPFVPPSRAKRYINGSDDRELFADNAAYPYGAAGKLYWSNGAWCSAALVGPRHVLTAKHCLTSDATGTFAPSFDNQPRFGESKVTNVVTTGIEWGSPCGWKNDWAILIIDQRMGDDRGFFGLQLPSKSMVDKPIFQHLGYPGDRDNGKRPYLVKENTIQSFRQWDCDITGPFYTDTDCAGGQSGGPLWENRPDGSYIWGTLSVTFEAGQTAWAGWGSGADMIREVQRLRREFP